MYHVSCILCACLLAFDECSPVDRSVSIVFFTIAVLLRVLLGLMMAGKLAAMERGKTEQRQYSISDLHGHSLSRTTHHSPIYAASLSQPAVNPADCCALMSCRWRERGGGGLYAQD